MRYISGLFENLKPKLKNLDSRLIAKCVLKLKDLVNTKLHFLIFWSLRHSIYLQRFFKRCHYIGESVGSLEINITEHVSDIKFERRKIVLCREYFREDTDVLFNEAKIIFVSQLKLQNLIRESTDTMDRKKDVCNDNISLNIHKM